MNEIPGSFWGLFRSPNRDIYIEALLKISEEYQYSSYFLSREVCIQVLGDYFSRKKLLIQREEQENDVEALEPPATRVLNWLVKNHWLKRQDDFAAFTVNIVIPDYAAVFVEAFERLVSEDMDEAEVYIQNIYTNLFSFKNDSRAGTSLLHTAVINTRRLNRALQDMLHNMDKFFTSLLEKRDYGELLKEHLDGYVEEIVRKKYHILKTSDTFYLYKSDIKQWLQEMREDEAFLEEAVGRSGQETDIGEAVRMLDGIERGFDDIERRIANMDREHTRYVRVTVSRLYHLLNREDDTKGLILQILNQLSGSDHVDDELGKISSKMNLSYSEILSEKSLYKKRRPRESFRENLTAEEAVHELTKDEILKLNKVKTRYSREEIDAFVESRMKDGKAVFSEDSVQTEEDFEKMILAYDGAGKKKGLYRAEAEEGEMIDNGSFCYPKITFIRRKE